MARNVVEARQRVNHEGREVCLGAVLFLAASLDGPDRPLSSSKSPKLPFVHLGPRVVSSLDGPEWQVSRALRS